ncbi:MAG: hypothetical protein GY758_25430 [Fuerstiella sp.]|nr:hypothetical protein [Fuerstiella sp.]MCP4511913.1 hypothetical protein [Fuerstiella sp.]
MQRFLNADLSEAEQHATERHLKACNECRQQPHHSAADPVW